MGKITLTDLSQNWLGLTTDYQPSAFWFWNSSMSPESIEQTISEMYRQGVREFLIHPIHGLDIEYLGQLYFERIRYALNIARKYGLRVWIYDEYGWPSGNAGGKLPEKHPEHKAWFLRISKTSNGTITAEPFLSDRILDNAVGANWTKSISGYLDTLSKDAVKCFIKMTHERYYEECQEFFADVIAGFFTDEPVTMIGCVENQRELWQAIGLPWTPEFPKLFKQECGYDIEKCYKDLACPDKSKTKEDYWNLIKRLHMQAYHDQIGRWCNEHGVKYTGHIGENVPLMQVRFSGSAFMSLGVMDVPGVDMLGCGLYPEHRSIEQVLVSSIAKHSGSKRVYCEAFGTSPFSIRLGQMLRGIQMLGIHGVNDIALMGFHQSLDGVRKRTYWPPLFTTAPWWSFYPVFRDACARSVGLTSLGKIKTRYAIFYPQYEIEQSNIFMDSFSTEDPILIKLNCLASAIYQTGEAFEFIFPENLANITIKDGLLTIGDAEYSKMIVLGEFSYSQESLSQVERLLQEGGQVEYAPSENIIPCISEIEPSWKQLIDIDCHDRREIRVCEYSYPDGSLFALLNTSGEKKAVSIRSNHYLMEWEPTSGKCTSQQDHHLDFIIQSDSTIYFSVSSLPFSHKTIKAQYSEFLPIDAQWSISTDNLNTARFLNIQFYHNEFGWLGPEISPSETKTSSVLIPSFFKEQTSIRMRGEFNCGDVPSKLGVIYEQEHFASLIVNGQSVALDNSQAFAGWDTSCRYVEISAFACQGTNIVEGTLLFEKFETTLFSHGFFTERPVMPTCDVCIAGSFKLLENVLVDFQNELFSLPCDLAKMGWSQYSGMLSIVAHIDIDQNIARNIRGLEVELISEDALEIFWDDISIGQKISYPYRVVLDSVLPGQHHLKLRISSTSGNILDEPSCWGIRTVGWRCCYSKDKVSYDGN